MKGQVSAHQVKQEYTQTPDGGRTIQIFSLTYRIHSGGQKAHVPEWKRERAPSQKWLSTAFSLILSHTYLALNCISCLRGVFKQIPTAKVFQLHIQCISVNKKILCFDVTVKNSTVTAVTSSLNHLTHDFSSHWFWQLTFVMLAEFMDVHAGAGPLQDQNVAIRHLKSF